MKAKKAMKKSLEYKYKPTLQEILKYIKAASILGGCEITVNALHTEFLVKQLSSVGKKVLYSKGLQNILYTENISKFGLKITRGNHWIH